MMSDDDDELDGKVDEKTINTDEIIKTVAKGTWGGKRPGTGGRRPGSGRKKGTPNKVTAEIKELAQNYGPEAIAELARLATKAESEAARVAAIKELLDRGYGRAVQPIEGSMTYGVSEQLAELFRENASGTLGSEIARRALPAPNGEHEQELH
jgi:hypothetical protein